MSRRGDGISRLAKAATPTLLGFFGVVLLALPIRLFEGGVPTPLLPLIVVVFWSIYGPSYMPAASIFFMGLLQDFLTGGPLGLWPAVYLTTQYIIVSQRAYFIGRDQAVVWLGFTFAASGAALILWLVMSLMSGVLLPVGDLIAQMLATIFLYPVFAAVFSRLHRRVIVEA